ncbi:hypothetical protein CCH79_00020712 [Gambusia affinis]|uniref:Grh/CP2 DB domain-containing protein n=1 Tax=Gambusia affinis TaxID=33528 RepID=A0A315VY23_GAMAF|nr:hypothetical protein CCH79_00020712 [Gambusia affinis]
MAWALKLPLTDEVIESGLVQDFDASLSGIGQELGAGAYSMSDVLALPIFKQEESNLPPETENKILPFQYVLCAPTSPAIKLHDETLTYLNQGQSYEIRMLDNRKIGELPEITGKMVKSIIRVVFHDRRLQYTEHQQLEGWRWNRPGDRILDLDIPMSVGIIDPRANPTQLNTVEFLWDPSKRTSVFIQCLSSVAEPDPDHLSVIIQFSCDLCNLLACGQSVLLKVGVKDLDRLRRETGAPFALFGRFAANELH